MAAPPKDINTHRTQTGFHRLTHNDGAFFAAEAFLDTFLEGIKHNLQQVAGSQGHGLVFHAQHGDHPPGSQHAQGGHCLVGGKRWTELLVGKGQLQ